LKSSKKPEKGNRTVKRGSYACIKGFGMTGGKSQKAAAPKSWTGKKKTVPEAI